MLCGFGAFSSQSRLIAIGPCITAPKSEAAMDEGALQARRNMVVVEILACYGSLRPHGSFEMMPNIPNNYAISSDEAAPSLRTYLGHLAPALPCASTILLLFLSSFLPLFLLLPPLLNSCWRPGLPACQHAREMSPTARQPAREVSPPLSVKRHPDHVFPVPLTSKASANVKYLLAHPRRGNASQKKN